MRFYPFPGGEGATFTADTLAIIEALTPAVGDQGRPTDSRYKLECLVAGTWSYSFEGILCFKPPTTGWTAYNSGSVAVVGGVRVLTIPAESFAGWRGETRAEVSDPTATPFFTEFILWCPWIGNAGGTGAVTAGFSDGTGLAFMTHGGGQARVDRWSAANTFVGSDVTIAVESFSYPFRMRVEQDAANRSFFIGGPNGEWTEMGAGFGRTVTFTANKVGWWAGGHDTEAARTIAMISYREGAL